MDSSDSLLSSIPMGYHSLLVLLMVAHVCIELVDISFLWPANICRVDSYVWPYYLTYEFIITFRAVFSMSCWSYLNGLCDER